MILQTQLRLEPKEHNQIDYSSNILMLGSCFTENIASKLDYYKFKTTVNPFGILFHPKAIENVIINAINEKKYNKEEFIFNNERWHCFDAHSDLSDSSIDNLLHKLNLSIKLLNRQILNATHIVITIGTAWVYRFIETDTIVANCHKVPQKKFLKELLTVDEITESLQALITLIQSVNGNVSILFTISPVRHLKDGIIENQRSKSHLITAVHQIIHTSHSTNYFPSYEIMTDELRDYRFYRKDMVHPNSTAIQYIWEKFSQTWLSKNTKQVMEEVGTIQKVLSHKPFNPNSKQHKEFLKHNAFKIKELQLKFPDISFNNEL